jgi:tetratricopeptide (TPR) repeat protein
MRRGKSIRAVGALLAASLALSVATHAQGNHLGSQTPSQNAPQKTKRAVNLSDEEWGDLYMARKTYDAAIDHYSIAIKSLENSSQDKAKEAALWNKTGICYQQKMDYGDARKAYKKAIRLDRDFAQPWNNLGTTYYLQQRPKRSIKFYRHAIKLNPQAASYHLNLGTAYFARKKYERASGEYRTAIQLDPEILTRNTSGEGTAVQTRHTDAKFYFYLAKIFASTGKSGQAVRYLERAMEEGFDNRKRILQDPDIQKIIADPAFVALMKNPPVAIKD